MMIVQNIKTFLKIIIKSVDQELHNFSISHKKLKFRECSFVYRYQLKISKVAWSELVSFGTQQQTKLHMLIKVFSFDRDESRG